jgi:hypothetical protein
LVVEDFRQAFLEKQQTLVYRQPEIAGLEQLRRLGWRLYRPARPLLVAPELVTPELVSL